MTVPDPGALRGSPARVGGVLLTGGTSRRLGTDKATLSVRGETLAARVARVLAAVADPCVEVGPGVSGLASVGEEPPGRGPLAALVAGAAALGAPSVLLVACDLPFLTTELLALLADATGDTVVPVVAGRAQWVCARYGPLGLAEAKARLDAGERSLRVVAPLSGTRMLAEAEWSSVATPEVFADVDTPDDLARLRRAIPEAGFSVRPGTGIDNS